MDAIKNAKRVANGTQKLQNLNKLYLARERTKIYRVEADNLLIYQIYRVEADGLVISNYTLKIMIFVNM